VNAEPSYTDFDDGTAENANLIFGTLPPISRTNLRQTFQLSSASQPELEQRVTRRGHAMPAPDNLSLGRHVLGAPAAAR
jgi:hypothetical protein